MSGFNDSTLGFQAIGFVGTAKMELHRIDVSNEVDAGFTVPSTLVSLLGWIGYGCQSLGCASGTMAPPITNVSLCEGPVLEVSIGDADLTSDDENTSASFIAWGW
jgi:hypothetical protein